MTGGRNPPLCAYTSTLGSLTRRVHDGICKGTSGTKDVRRELLYTVCRKCIAGEQVYRCVHCQQMVQKYVRDEVKVENMIPVPQLVHHLNFDWDSLLHSPSSICDRIKADQGSIFYVERAKWNRNNPLLVYKERCSSCYMYKFPKPMELNLKDYSDQDGMIHGIRVIPSLLTPVVDGATGSLLHNTPVAMVAIAVNAVLDTQTESQFINRFSCETVNKHYLNASQVVINQIKGYGGMRGVHLVWGMVVGRDKAKELLSLNWINAF